MRNLLERVNFKGRIPIGLREKKKETSFLSVKKLENHLFVEFRFEYLFFSNWVQKGARIFQILFKILD